MASKVKTKDSRSPNGFRFLSLPRETRQKILFYTYDPDTNTDLLGELRKPYTPSSRIVGSPTPWHFWFRAFTEMWIWSRTLEQVDPVITDDMIFVFKTCEDTMQ